MQYDVNHAYMVGNRVVIHEPHKVAKHYLYLNEKLEPTGTDHGLAQEALAFALWPVLAYRERNYTLPGETSGRPLKN